MEFELSGAVADTLESVSTWILFDWLFLYLNPRACVNTILTHFLRLRTPRETGGRETAAQRAAAACARSGAKSVRIDPSAPVTDRENPGSGRAASTVSVPASGEAWVIAQASA
jgi:hypothetical protein